MSKKIELDGEAADRITMLNLKEHRGYLKKDLKYRFKEGHYLHPDDVVGNTRLIEAITLVLKYYGEP